LAHRHAADYRALVRKIQCMPDSSSVSHAICCRLGELFFAPEARQKRKSSNARVNMDAHLIGIDVAQLLLRQNARIEKQAPVKAKSDAKSARAAKGSSAGCY
jgi:hypothetical protein